MNLPMTVFLFCFFGDGHEYNDQCRDARFETDTVVECRTVGESTPLNINTGVSNPGLGTIMGYSTFMGERTLLWSTNFGARGYSSYPVPTVVLTVDYEVILIDNMEECDCFTRIPGGCD